MIINTTTTIYFRYYYKYYVLLVEPNIKCILWNQDTSIIQDKYSYCGLHKEDTWNGPTGVEVPLYFYLSKTPVSQLSVH